MLIMLCTTKSIFAQPYVGEVKLFAGNYAPPGWLICDGRLLPIAEYDILFTLIGTTYGGDGQENFALPDLRGRVPQGSGSGPGLSNRIIGGPGGAAQTSLSLQNMPSHNHSTQLMVNDQRATTATPSASTYLTTSGSASGRGFRPNLAYNNLVPTIVLQTVTTDNTGTSQPINIMKPYGVITYIISAFGVWPQQN